MNIKKIESIKISLMEMTDDENLDPLKSDFIIRSSISINLQDLKISKSEDEIRNIVADMFVNLKPYLSGPEINYVGLWVKYDGEVFDNAIKLQTLEDIERYSPEKLNGMYEFVKMSIPE